MSVKDFRWEFQALIKKVVTTTKYDVEVDLGFRIKHKMRISLLGWSEISNDAVDYVRDKVEGKIVILRPRHAEVDEQYVADIILLDGRDLKLLIRGWETGYDKVGT